MGGVGDFQLYEGVCFAFELYCLIRFACGTREEHIAVAHVLEHYGAIVVGMYALFHVFLLFFLLVAGNNSVQWSFFFMCKCLFAEHFSLVSPMRSVHRWLVCEQKSSAKLQYFFCQQIFLMLFCLEMLSFLFF